MKDIEPRQPIVPNLKGAFKSGYDELRKQVEIDLEEKYPPQVDHPNHYNQQDKEVIDMMLDIYGEEDVIAFCRLNAFKYRMRAGHKGDATQDIEKALWYETKINELQQ
jgi:hypothetical protein